MCNIHSTIKESDAVLIIAGALDDYDSYSTKIEEYCRKSEYSINTICKAEAFTINPASAWGYYGILKKYYNSNFFKNQLSSLYNMVTKNNDNYFVYTSDISGNLKKAGFHSQKIVEAFGNINYLQCSGKCQGIVKAQNIDILVDPNTMKSLNTPICKKCSESLRPNISLINDWQWDYSRVWEQKTKLQTWKDDLKINGKNLLILEVNLDRKLFNLKSKLISTFQQTKTIKLDIF